MWSHHTPPLRSVGSCPAPPVRFWFTSHPQLCWERDKQVLALPPWGGSCLRSHLSATSMAEAGLAQDPSI